MASSKTCQKCVQGFRIDDKNPGNCLACSAGCQRCDDTGNCIVCNPGYWLDQGSCFTCQAGCLKCDLVNKKCLACQDGFWYDSDTEKCLPCSENCFKCDSKGKCLECQLNSHIITESSTCVKNISDYCSEYDVTNGKCVNCFGNSTFKPETGDCLAYPPNCVRIDADNNCLACTGISYLNPVTQLCEDCKIQNCLQCGANNTCEQCQKGFYFNGVAGTCTACDSTCADCTAPNGICVECVDITNLFDKRNPSTCATCQSVFGQFCLGCSLGGLGYCSTCHGNYTFNAQQEKCMINYEKSSVQTLLVGFSVISGFFVILSMLIFMKIRAKIDENKENQENASTSSGNYRDMSEGQGKIEGTNYDDISLR